MRKRRLVWCFLLGMCFLTAVTQAAVIVTTGAEANFNDLSDAAVYTGSTSVFTYAQKTNGSMAQTFTVGSEAIAVTSVNLTYENNTSEDATLTMHIFPVDNPNASTINLPATPMLTETFTVPNVGGSDTHLTITLGSSLTLAADTSYAVYFDVSDASAQSNIEWFRTTSTNGSVYADGAFYQDGAIKTSGERDASLALDTVPPANYNPIVSAGDDVYLLLGEMVELDAAATDPEGAAMTYAWSYEGPGTATFTALDVLDPNVTFDDGGMYTLTLEVSDGENVVSDSLQVAVYDAADNKLIGYWDFETTPTEPNVVLDETDVNNDGLWSSSEPNYIDGWITGASPDLAAKFFGDKHIAIVPADTNELNNDLQYGLTVACWIRVDDAGTFEAFDRILDKDVWGLSASSSAETVKFNLTGQNSNGITAVTPVTDGFWHHVAGVYDGQTMAIYVDGVEEASRSTWVFLPTTIGTNLTIGANSDAVTGQYLSGVAVDDVRVYNYGLSEAEVQALAAMGDNLVFSIDIDASADGITLPTDTVTLDATVTNPDGDVMTYAWSMVDGPAAVTFDTPAAADANAVFTDAGYYTLRLSVDDGTVVLSEDVAVVVYPEGWDIDADDLAYMPYDVNPNDMILGDVPTVFGTPTYAAGRVGNAVVFDGDDYLEYDTGMGSVDLDGTDLTFMAWVRADQQVTMEIAGNYWNGTADSGWRLMFDEAGYFRVWLGNNYQDDVDWAITDATYTVGEWVHVALVLHPNIGEDQTVMRFYLNGEQVGDSQTADYLFVPNPEVPFTVGKRPLEDSGYLVGAVDELYLIGRYMTASTIAVKAGLDLPPTVDLGDQIKHLLPGGLYMEASVEDDNEGVSVEWSCVATDGTQDPNDVTFAPADDPNSMVTFPGIGRYLLRLTATDSGAQEDADEVWVKVRPEGFDGLEAHLTFESTDPNVAVNSSLNGVLYEGAAYGDPNLGINAGDAKMGAGALLLNGTDQYVEYNEFLGAEPEITVALWLKPKAIDTNYRVIEKWANDYSNLGWFIRIRSANNYGAMIGSRYNGPGLYRVVTDGVADVAVDEWSHVVLTSKDGQMRIWVNGALLVQATDTDFSPADMVTPMNLGRRQNTGGDRYFNGLIDEVRIYDYALSVEEIKAIYAGDGGVAWDTCPNFAADLTGDCRVDLQDMAEISAGWQSTYTMDTLTAVAADWLECNSLDLSDCF